MDPAAAAKLVESLDRELAKRRRKKYDGLIAQWRKDYADLVARGREEWGDDETIDDEAVDDAGDDAGRAAVYVFCRLIEHQKAYGPFPAEFFPPPGDIDERIRLEEFFAEHGGVEGVADAISELARRLRVRDRILEEQRNGAPRRRPVIITPKVRAPHLLGRDPAMVAAKTVDGEKTAKRSRTEIWAEQEQAKLQARVALISPPHQGEESAGEWLYGSVRRYDSRSTSGIVALGGGPGGLELPFGISEIMRAGITSLHPSQAVECRVTKRADGTAAVAEIKLSAGERAAAIAEPERQAQAAEENYRVELMRRGLH